MDPKYFDIEREQNPRERANFISKFSFWYTRPIFVKGRKGQLSISDVYRCSPGHRAAPRGDVLGQKWKTELEKQEKGKKPSLLRAILRIYGLKFVIANVVFALCETSFKLIIPMCLEGLINYFSTAGPTVSTTHAYLYALGVVGLMALNATMIHPMLLWLLDMAMKIRVGCCSLIYRKLLRLDLNAGGKASEGLAGHVINLLTTDAQRFDMASLFITDLIRSPLESSLIVYLMYRQIGVAAFIGVAFLLMFIPLQGYLGKISSKLRRKTAVRTDNRIRMMNEVIQSIEAIKMYAWENAFAKIIGQARKKEMNVIKKMSWLRAVMISCVKLNTKVAIFLSVISFISFKNDLTAAKVYVIFSYYEMLRFNLVDFLPLAITFTLEAYVSVKRMQEFLLLPEVDNQDGIDLVTIDEVKTPVSNGVFEKIGNGQQAYIKSENNLQQLKPQVLISMKNYTAHWRNVEDESLDRKVAALSDINLAIKPETLTVVVGTVGSGKSTLLQAMLRELTPTSGQLSINGVIAYAAQDPWLFEASVRQNILFGQEMNLQRYKQVIKCCQLKSDLEILSHGDKTVVGERGASLSGGQRARISLARCVYQNADVYLLDDPLAAVDAKVAQAIYEDCIRGFLRDKATVLVTHHVHYARNAAVVAVMRNGKVNCIRGFLRDKATVLVTHHVHYARNAAVVAVMRNGKVNCIRGFLRDKATVLVTHHVHYARNAAVVAVMRNGKVNCIRGFLRDKATVLVTHHVHYARNAAVVAVMRNGKVNCIRGFLRDKATVLVTHHVHYARNAAVVAVMRNGKVTIYDDCIRGFLRDKATVLVTHHVHYARNAAVVAVMRNGKVNCIRGFLRDKATVLVTHHVHYARNAAVVAVMRNGKVNCIRGFLRDKATVLVTHHVHYARNAAVVAVMRNGKVNCIRGFLRDKATVLVTHHVHYARNAAVVAVMRNGKENCTRGFLRDKATVLVTHHVHYARNAAVVAVMRNGKENCIRGFLRDKATVLVTHHVHYARNAAVVAVMRNGKVKSSDIVQAIYEDCIRGFLRDKAAVLVTHHVHYARNAAVVAVMRNGKVKYSDIVQAIYEDCIRGFLRDKATVLVTHHVHYARNAAVVAVMRNGKIVAQGTYHELKNGVPEFEKLLEVSEKIEEEKQKKNAVNYENQESVEHNYKIRSQRSMSEASQLSFNLDLDNNLDPKYEGENQNKGSVSKSVYMSYINSGGTRASVALLVILFILAQVFYSATDIWLKDCGATRASVALLVILFILAQVFYSATDIWLKDW
ncbi:hypothetical protein ABMA28_011576 [Loxostege sticticalis]|uniref:Multidrug resistance-associated protein lethal(2)03659 n=1 Tax=Loxostege sticticalis TaxID=481309 RepID=A0ABD0S7U5_LOXSC